MMVNDPKNVVPTGFFRADDAAAARRKQIAEALRRGNEVAVTNSGQVVQSTDSAAQQPNTLKAPPGKLA